MSLALSAFLIGFLFIIEILRPVLHFNKWRQFEAYNLELKMHQLRVVREFYPVLDNLSLDEIEEKYGLAKVYNSVGRAYLKHR